jgi:xanthine dehydrogenase accessory factor
MDDLPIYEEIIRLKKGRIPAALATVVETRGSSPRKAGAKMLVRQDGTIAGTVGGGQIEADTIGAAIEVIRLGQPRTLSFSLTEQHGGVCGGEMLIYLEPLFVPQHLVVVGGGHVGRAVSQAARSAGFLVTLISTVEPQTSITISDEIRYHQVEDLQTAFAEIGVDSGTYVFIATSDHRQDFLATATTLRTEARYIGLLGSSRKRLALEKYLSELDFTANAIDRITSPAGLEIGAETPAEIAVSVVAQMIGVRRSGRANDIRAAAGGRAVKTDGVQQQTFAAAGS